MSSYQVARMKSELEPRKQLAAQLIVENEFTGALEGGKRTFADIAEEVGITRQSLHTWRQDRMFIQYMAHLSDRHLDAQRAYVDSRLMDLIIGTSNNGTPSVKALEMYYKLSNRLVDRSVVETVDNEAPKLTSQQIDAGIEELASKLRQVDSIIEVDRTEEGD